MSILPEQPDFDTAFAVPALSLWREAAEAALKGADFERSLYTRTLEGLSLKPLYTAADNAAGGAARAIQLLRSPGWQMAQEIPLVQPERFAEALARDLDQGLDGLWLDLDALAPESAADLAIALAPLSPGQIPIQLACSQPLAGQIAVESWLQARGASWADFRGSLCSDGLAALARHGQGDPERHFDALAALVRSLREQDSQLSLIGIDALPWHEAGAHAAQELAFGCAALVETLQQLDQRGVSSSLACAGGFSLRLGVGVSFFMELAKFRAARLLLSRLAQVYGCAPALIRLQARTSHLWLTRLDPYTNFLRQTVGALAAVLGGADLLSTGAFSEAAGAPDDFACRLARNLQLILRHEVKLDRLLDPVGGSYFVESLTTQLAEAAWAQFQQLEAEGGLLSALQAGRVQAAVHATARQRQLRVHTRKQVLVGTNQYANPDDVASAEHTEPALAAAAELAPLALGDDPSPEAHLAAGRAAFAAGASWPSLATALAGEPSLRVTPLEPLRLAAGFEALRAEAAARPYRVLLLPFGQAKDYRPRVEFAQALFAVAGMQIQIAEPLTGPHAALAALAAQPAEAIVLCGADAAYETLIPELAPALKAAFPELPLVLAGRPAGRDADYAAAGIDHFIHLGGDAHAVLCALLAQR